MFGLFSQGVGLRPQPWAPFSRPVGPAGWLAPKGIFLQPLRLTGRRIPPVEAWESAETLIESDEAATRVGGEGRKINVIDVIPMQSEVPAPALPLCAAA